MTEGVIRDANDIRQITDAGDSFSEGNPPLHAMDPLKLGSKGSVVRVELGTDVEVSVANLQRNFYTTSSCGICGKASLLALRTVCPPRARDILEWMRNCSTDLPGRLPRIAGSV